MRGSPRRRTLPLGIDIGSSRVRIALCERDSDGTPRLVAVAARDGTGAVALGSALADLRTRERRGVLALAHPEGLLQHLVLPPMRPSERRAAARLAAANAGATSRDRHVVSLQPVAGHPQHWTLAVAVRSALATRIAVARAARVRVVGVDDAALALRRALSPADAVVEIGADVTRVVLWHDPLPRVETLPIGGRQLTQAIADALGIETEAAERRKRTLGFAGAGESIRDRLVEQIAEALAAICAERGAPRTVALCGNGARIPGLAATLQGYLAVDVEPCALAQASQANLPPDVIRSAAPDWALAFGLSLWAAA